MQQLFALNYFWGQSNFSPLTCHLPPHSLTYLLQTCDQGMHSVPPKLNYINCTPVLRRTQARHWTSRDAFVPLVYAYATYCLSLPRLPGGTAGWHTRITRDIGTAMIPWSESPVRYGRPALDPSLLSAVVLSSVLNIHLFSYQTGSSSSSSPGT